MPLSEITKKRVERALSAFCERRVPFRFRHKVRLVFSFRGNSVNLVEERPFFRDPSRWTHSAVAQFRFDEATLRWTLYCRDRNSKWHRYEGATSTTNVDDLLAAVDHDPTGIFWG